jgi:transposase
VIHLIDEQFDRLLLEHPKLNHNDRKALGLILEVLRTGCPWQDAPEEEFGVVGASAGTIQTLEH